MADWKPIETAPKDRHVLLYGESLDIGIGIHWSGDYWRFVDGDGLCDDYHRPTLWHPLPEAPNG